MQAIGSSNGYYTVSIRGIDKPLRMSIAGGEKLSSYLTGEPRAFVEIKDTSGNVHVIRTGTIDRVARFNPTQANHYKTPQELGMPDLSKY